ncbi:hypothetical protein BC830DRAFT_1175170, partial [Chytriomyces sp. MP71]
MRASLLFEVLLAASAVFAASIPARISAAATAGAAAIPATNSAAVSGTAGNTVTNSFAGAKVPATANPAAKK